jgi:chemotaxis regulatin CheY-phosphate phosphatase CheZ
VYRKVYNVVGKEAAAKQKMESVSAAQSVSDALKETYDTVSRTLIREFEQFKNKKAADMKRIISDFILLQIECNEKAERAWSELYPKV